MIRRMSMKYDFDCVIVGAGIAGMTAAIYLKRANLNVLILDNDTPGGLLNKISVIENYPGFNSISGPDLAYKLYEQVKALDVEIRYGRVLNIDDHVVTTDIEKITADKVILAVGRKARKIDNTNDLKNVSYCALCDASLYKDKIVAIVGCNNTAIEEALYLSDICQKVIVLCRNQNLNGEETLIDRLKDKQNVDLQCNCVIQTLKSKNNILTKIITNNGEFLVDGMFVAIGYEPSVEFLDSVNKEDGYIVVNNKMQTNIDYIFACGDIIKKDVYQLTTAVGEATIAAINVKKELKNFS